MIQPNNSLVPLAAACSILAATATAQDSSAPLLPDRCTAKAHSIFLGSSEHDTIMRKDFIDRCHIREREKELRSKGRSAEEDGSPRPKGGQAGRQTDEGKER